MSDTQPSVVSEVLGSVGRIVLNRPSVLNALNADMLRRIGAITDQWRDDPAVTTVLLEGAGDRGFCAGGDVREVRQVLLDEGPDAAEAYFALEYGVDLALVEFPKPVVAFATGITMGGGVGLLGGADVRIVTETTKMAMPETKIGFTPDVGGTWMLSHAPGHVGEFLALTGHVMGAADVLFAGLADVLVPRAELPALRDALISGTVGAGEIPGRPRAHLEPGQVERSRIWIDEAFAAASVTEIVERLRRMPEPNAEDALSPAKVVAELEQRAPTALVVTLAAVRAARKHRDRRENFARELDVMSWYIRTQPDVAEGIRAQLVDKDFAPRWQPATLAEVDPRVADEALAARSVLPLPLR